MNHIPTILLPINTKGDLTLARESIAHGLEKQFPRVGYEIKNHVKDGRDVLDCLITNLAVSAIANDQLDKELKEANDTKNSELKACEEVATKGYDQAYQIIETQKQRFREENKKHSDQIEELEDQVQQLQQALAMFRNS